MESASDRGRPRPLNFQSSEPLAPPDGERPVRPSRPERLVSHGPGATNGPNGVHGANT